MQRYGASASCLLLAGALLLCASAPSTADEASTDFTGPEVIRAAALSAVQSRAHSSGSKLTAVAATLDPRLRLHHCDTPLQGFIAGDGQLHDSATIGVRCEGPVRWTVYIRVTLSSERTVLAARHLLPRGSELSADDFEAVTRHVDGAGERYLDNPSVVAGLRLRLPVASGALLTIDAVEQAPMVRRGQQVTLLARTASMEIRVAAIALSDGRAQQRINVQNQSTHQTVEAIVRSAALVEVPL